MKNFFWFLLLLGLGIGLFFWSFENVNFKEIKVLISSFSFGQALIILAVALLSYLLNVGQWKIVLETLSWQKFSFFDLLKVWLAGWSVNFLTPVALIGGEAVMIGGLKLSKEKDFPTFPSIASVILIRILSFSSAIFFILLGLGVLIFYQISIPSFLELLVFSLVLALAFFYFLAFKKTKLFSKGLAFLEKKFFKVQAISEIEDLIFSFFSQKEKLASALALGILSNLAILLRIYLLFWFMGIGVSLNHLLVVLSFLHLGYLLALPANLGSLEFFQKLAFSFFGLSGPQALAFSISFRASELFWVLVGVLILANFWLSLNKKLLNKAFNEQFRDS